jgi:hypothetical protein
MGASKSSLPSVANMPKAVAVITLATDAVLK